MYFLAKANKTISAICLVFLLHPLWWVIGVDQFIIPVSIYLLFAVLFATRKLALKGFFPNLILISYIFFHFVPSAVVITEPDSSFYFPLYLFRTFLFLSGPILFLIIMNSIKESDDINCITNTITLTLLWSVLASAVFYSLFVFNITEFRTIMGRLMPSVSNIGILYQSTIKEMIRHTWIFNLSFFRTRGLYTYSNLFAFSLEIGIMLGAYMAVSKKSLLYGLISLSSLTALILTTSRAGITILIVGSIITIISISRHKLVIVLGIAIPVLSFWLLNLAGYNSFFSPKSFFEESSENLIKMREDSTEGRMMLYEVTLKQVLEKPFFGWGTYRKYPNHPNWPYLGSHSTFLSSLYRLGIFGTISLIAIILLILKNIILLLIKDNDPQSRLLCSFLLGILCMNAAHMVVLDIHDDIFTLNIMWATWAISPALKERYYRKNEIQYAY